MIAAIIIGALITLYGLRNQRVNINHALAYAIAAQGMAFGIVMAVTYPFINYMNFGMWVMWGMGTFLMIPLVVIRLACCYLIIPIEASTHLAQLLLHSLYVI